MIDKVFFQILNMSFASSFAIIFVLFARLILKKSSQGIFLYLMECCTVSTYLSSVL